MSTGRAPGIAAWISAHAREDLVRGRKLPGGLRELVATLLNPVTSADGSKSAPSEIVIIGTPEMARRMGCTDRWVRERCEQGQIPGAHKVDGRWLIVSRETDGQDDDRDREVPG